MELDINNHQKEVDVSGLEPLIRQVLETAHHSVGITDETEISITFVNNRVIRELNKKYRKIDRATDVLSFALEEEGFIFEQAIGLPRILGDIVISLERAHAQSCDYGHSFKREVGYLTVHGFLHLIGYDHQNDADKKQMRLKEEEIMSQLNLIRD